MKSLGERIKIARGTVSQTVFSDQLGVTQNTLSRYERGQRIPDAGFIIDLCKKFNISANWILFGEGEKTRSTGSSPQIGQGTLEKRLETSEEERRELAIENRKLWKENSELQKEVGNLKASLARLEERMDKPLVSRGPAEMGNLG